MPSTINGLPLHPLVVHAVVVLLPLSALGVIAIAIHAPWRRRYGLLVIAVAALATAAIPLATETGEQLERHVGDPGRHAALGDTLIWFALPLLAVAAGVALIHRWRPATSRPAATVLAVVAVAVATANLVQVYRVGDSGAKAVWGNTVSTSHKDATR